jgi:putative inorganic carbon (hco3(-)) transporter
MSLKGLIFIGLLGLCAVGALFSPQLGIYGYLVDYCISPSNQWWGSPFVRMGLRGSFFLALATLIGIILQHKKLKFGEKFLYVQEWSLLLFLIVIWTLTFLSPETVGRYSDTDHPSIKLTKIFFFALMMTHIITDIKKLNNFFWTLASVSLFLGVKAWNTPFSHFVGGRLEGIGGADFGEANFFGAFMAAMLPLIGIQFLQSKKWIGKLYALVCGAFTANAVILCRSRGAFLGMAMGALASLWFAPKGLRKKIFILLLVGAVGVVCLTDKFFVKRVVTITTDQSNMDVSASGRITLWKDGAKIFVNNPMGVGPGNWYQTMRKYIPEYKGFDAHNTFVKCAVELGIPGIMLFLLLIIQAYFNLKKVAGGLAALSPEDANNYRQYYFSMIVSIVVFLACAMTITTIYTEILWVLLMLPVCLRRAYDNVVMAGNHNRNLAISEP